MPRESRRASRSVEAPGPPARRELEELEEELEEVTAELLEMQQSKESTIQDLEQK